MFSTATTMFIETLSQDYAGFEKFNSIDPDLLFQLSKPRQTREEWLETGRKIIASFNDEHLRLITPEGKLNKGLFCKRYNTELYVTKENNQLRRGDVITHVDGCKIADCKENVLNHSHNHETLKEQWSSFLSRKEILTIERNDDCFDVKVSECRLVSTSQLFSLKEVADDTMLMSIPDFWNTESIEDLVEHYKRSTGQNKNLIIDIRGNGGGADTAFQSLLPLVFAPLQKVIVPQHEHRITPKNISQRLSLLREYVKANPSGELIEHIEVLESLKQSFGWQTFASSFEYEVQGTSVPECVILLFDEDCGSSAESFILLAKQSEKVTTIGRSTLGCWDYSNVAYQDLPNVDATLQYGTSRYVEVTSGNGIDSTGISPDIFVDWTPQSITDDIVLSRALYFLEKL